MVVLTCVRKMLSDLVEQCDRTHALVLVVVSGKQKIKMAIPSTR